MEKTCNDCGEIKNLNEFYKHGKHGHHPCCKKCFNKKYYEDKKSEVLEYHREYYAQNSDKIKKRVSEHKKLNRDRYNRISVEYKKKNPIARIASNMRVRIGNFIKEKSASGRTRELLGCDFEFLKQYLESQFDEDMIWENYGSYWNIDHIIPCIAFNLENEEELKRCFHYSNLQPLEAKVNFSKNDMLPNGIRQRSLKRLLEKS